MLYQAYLEYLFGNVDVGSLDKCSIDRYKEELKRWHSKSYLNTNMKIKYVRDYILK